MVLVSDPWYTLYEKADKIREPEYYFTLIIDLVIQ